MSHGIKYILSAIYYSVAVLADRKVIENTEFTEHAVKLFSWFFFVQLEHSLMGNKLGRMSILGFSISLS